MFSIAAYFFVFMALGFSCQRNNSKEVEDAVYYFPAKNVYYDGRQSRYYYSLNGGGTWDSMHFRGAAIGTTLGPKITIDRAGENIWMNNDEDRKKYNGVLLNTVNSQTILVAKNDSISKVKPLTVAGKKPVVVASEPPPKKGLKKFFNNLFGKKKKQSAEKQ